MINSTEEDWQRLKSEWKVGQIVEGTVLAHFQFGVFVSLAHNCVGLINIPYFKEIGERMTPQEYPKLGETVRAVIVDFGDRNHQVALHARPSDLAKAEALER